MWLYEKIVSQKSEPEGASWTESGKSCHVRCCWGFLAVRSWNTHSGDTQMNSIHTNRHIHTHSYTPRRVCLCGAVLGSWSHQPKPDAATQRGRRHRCLSVNQHGWSSSINNTHTGPNNKTSKSLSPVSLPHAREGLPRSTRILWGSLLDLHSLFIALFTPNIMWGFHSFWSENIV